MFHRIQKLMVLGEYRHHQQGTDDGTDNSSVRILIESPFAQVDRCGRGIRTVQLGLAKRWLFVAVDDFRANPRPTAEGWWKPQADPEVDCLELLSALPLRFVRLKVERHNAGRDLLRVTLVTGRCLYFEFGGGTLRLLLVNLWRDWIQQLKEERRRSRRKRNSGGEEEGEVEQQAAGPLLKEQLPGHLRRFLEYSSSSKASTDVESCVYEWDRRHRTREKRQLAAKVASFLSRSGSEHDSIIPPYQQQQGAKAESEQKQIECN